MRGHPRGLGYAIAPMYHIEDNCIRNLSKLVIDCKRGGKSTYEDKWSYKFVVSLAYLSFVLDTFYANYFISFSRADVNQRKC